MARVSGHVRGLAVGDVDFGLSVEVSLLIGSKTLQLASASCCVLLPRPCWEGLRQNDGPEKCPHPNTWSL